MRGALATLACVLGVGVVAGPAAADEPFEPEVIEGVVRVYTTSCTFEPRRYRRPYRGPDFPPLIRLRKDFRRELLETLGEL